MRKAKGLSLMSGGLDSQLAVKVLQRAGAEVEAVMFVSPFFKEDTSAESAARALGVRLHKVDFTERISRLLVAPPHGFGSAMNPCIDCHAAMINAAGSMMVEMGYDFVATGEVLGQRPMSQNRQALGVVERASGLEKRLIRPLSALLLEPSIVESEGLVDRSALLDISGRGRERQIALAAEFGITSYPSPAGGCRLTEEGFARRVRDVVSHEGIDKRWLLDIMTVGRRFRLPGGSLVVLGRDKGENALLRQNASEGLLLTPSGVPGPDALVVSAAEEDVPVARKIVDAYSRGAPPEERERFRTYQIM